MTQTKPQPNKVYRIVDGKIETIKVLSEYTSPHMGTTTWYHVEYEDGKQAECNARVYPKTQSDAWQEWANDRVEGILVMKERIRTSQDMICILTRELRGER